MKLFKLCPSPIHSLLFILITFIGFVHIQSAVFQQDEFTSLNIQSSKLLLQEGETIEDYVIRKTLFPFYMEKLFSILKNDDSLRSLFEGEITTDCEGHAMTWIHHVLTCADCEIFDKDVWVAHMFDAWGKPPEGLLSGHIHALGDYDECVNIKVTDLTKFASGYETIGRRFGGKYCATYLLPQNRTSASPAAPPLATRESVTIPELLDLMSIAEGILLLPSIATCFPDSCSKDDVQIILNNAFKMIYDEIGIETNGTTAIWPVVSNCYVKDKPDFDAGDISMITILGIIGALCVIGTAIDEVLKKKKEKSKPPIYIQVLTSFSLTTNITKWLSTRSSPDDLGCLHGIRFMSTTWVILGHTWYMITFIPVWNMVDLKKIHENFPIQTILNGSIAVDTFFVLSGLITAFNLLKILEKTGRINVFSIYLHRYLRLTPTYAIIVGIMATLVPYLGSGPSWYILDRWSEFCEDNWWTNLLYVNNFVNTSWLCQGEAFYLANDMQFFLVSPALVYPLFRWELIGIISLGVFSVLSILSPILLVHFFDTLPTTIGTRDSNKWFREAYIKPYARIQTYIIGIWLGYILFKTRGKRIKLNKIVVILLWLLAAASSLAALYGMYPYYDPLKPIPKAASLLYTGLHRVAWGLAISWVIFACIKGYGGIINTFLSWKVFMPLGRLGYCVYLVSLHLQMILHLGFRQPLTFEPYSMTNFFFAHLVMSYLVGFVCTITMESPFIQLEKIILGGGSRPPKPVKSPDAETPNEVTNTSIVRKMSEKVAQE